MDWSDLFSSSDAVNPDVVAYAVPDQAVQGADLGQLDDSLADNANAAAADYAGLNSALYGSQDGYGASQLPVATQGPLAAVHQAAAEHTNAAADPNFKKALAMAMENEKALPATIESANGAPSGLGVFSKLMKGLGISGDMSNPDNISALMKLAMGAGGVISALHNKGQAQNGRTPQELMNSINPNGTAFNAAQQATANNYFNTPTGNFATRARRYSGDMPTPIVAGVGSNGRVPARFADGGMVNPGMGIDPTNVNATNPNQYPYQQAQPVSPVSNNYAEGGKVDNGNFVSDGALSLVHGKGGGQEDLVHAKLSPGEYVMDADTVASLGDGNNAHGAKVLDAWREELRAHKRSADSDSIPPQAKAPSHYLKGGALSAVHNAKGK